MIQDFLTKQILKPRTEVEQRLKPLGASNILLKEQLQQLGETA